MVGYRYFSTFRTPVRYPFGHGLSYTTFRTHEPQVQLLGDDDASVSVEVTNTGTRAGKHVVQVYIATEAGPVRRPIRELRGFEKVDLAAGETKTVRISLPRRAFAYWDIRLERWIVAPGDYRVQVCVDAATVVQEAIITLAGDEIITELTMDSPMGEWFDHPLVGSQVMERLGFASASVSAEQMAMVASMTMRQFLHISGLPIPAEVLDELMLASRPN
jgi:beta-glucosidase